MVPDSNSKPRRGFRLRRRKSKRPKKRRELPIYILPNLFTTGNLFCGFFSILKSIEGNYLMASYFILLAMLFDLVDGRVARVTRSTTPFGMEYDSICDVVSFGVGPSLLVYFWSLQPYGRIGWLVSFLYLACGAMRLARFNAHAHQGEEDKGYFRGLPIPAAAGVIATSILFHQEVGIESSRSPFMLGVTFAVAYFMVSSIRFKSFKDFDFKRNHAFSKLVGSVVVLIGIASMPEIMLFVAILYYVFMNVVAHLWRAMRNKQGASKEVSVQRRSHEK